MLGESAILRRKTEWLQVTDKLLTIVTALKEAQIVFIFR